MCNLICHRPHPISEALYERCSSRACAARLIAPVIRLTRVASVAAALLIGGAHGVAAGTGSPGTFVQTAEASGGFWRKTWELSHRGLVWLKRIGRLAPFVDPVIDGLDELRRIIRDTHRAAEAAKQVEHVSRKLEELEKRLDDSERRAADLVRLKVELNEIVAQLKRLPHIH